MEGREEFIKELECYLNEFKKTNSLYYYERTLWDLLDRVREELKTPWKEVLLPKGEPKHDT